MLDKAVEEHSGKNLAGGYGQKRCTSVIVTGLAVSFPFVEVYNGGILKVLGYGTCGTQKSKYVVENDCLDAILVVKDVICKHVPLNLRISLCWFIGQTSWFFFSQIHFLLKTTPPSPLQKKKHKKQVTQGRTRRTPFLTALLFNLFTVLRCKALKAARMQMCLFFW